MSRSSDNPYTMVRQPSGETTVTVRLDQLERPATSYHATWAGFVADDDGILLCFGQRLEGTLLSRLDVALAYNEFQNIVDNSLDFFALLRKDQPAGSPDAWAVLSTMPVTHKYLVETATFCAMTYFGGQAELVFYRMSARDMYESDRNAHHKLDPPIPVVGVTMSRRMLSWLSGEMTDFRNALRVPKTYGVMP